MPGVDARVLLAFAVSAGAPLVALAALGGAALFVDDVPADKLALTALVLGCGALVSGLLALKLVARSFALSLRGMRQAIADVERGDFETSVRDPRRLRAGRAAGRLQPDGRRAARARAAARPVRPPRGHARGATRRSSAASTLGGEQREAAVLFVDLIGSTALAAERVPTRSSSCSTGTSRSSWTSADEHGGWVNKFEGDAALCVFGAPHDMDDPAGCALAAAREMDERLRAELPELGGGDRRLGGHASWPATSAHAERFEYTVIGDPVNEAARLTQLAKSTERRVLASACTLERVTERREQWRWRTDGQATLRGRPEPTQLMIPVSA